MTARVDVGIDAQRDPRHAPERGRRGGDPVEFTCRLRVDRADVQRNRRGELVARLADAGEDDVCRLESGTLSHPNLTQGVGVDPAAERAQQAQQRESRVGLERVVNRVRVVGKRRVDLAVRVANGVRTVHVDWRPDGLDDGAHADVVAEKTRWRGLER